jgi:hypothetical protein
MWLSIQKHVQTLWCKHRRALQGASSKVGHFM